MQSSSQTDFDQNLTALSPDIGGHKILLYYNIFIGYKGHLPPPRF